MEEMQDCESKNWQTQSEWQQKVSVFQDPSPHSFSRALQSPRHPSTAPQLTQLSTFIPAFPIQWEAKSDLRVKTRLQLYRVDQNQSQSADPWEPNETAKVMQKSIKLTKHYNLKLLQIIFWVYPEKHSAE